MTKLFVLVLCLPGVAFGAAILRQTSQQQNAVQAPPNDELVYAIEEDGTVSAYVGKNGLALPVADPASLRTARVRPFSEDELDIAYDGTMADDVTGNPAYGPGTITISQLSKEPIGEIAYEPATMSINPPDPKVTISINGSVATVRITQDYITNLRVLPAAEVPEVDLTYRDIWLKDSRGGIHFSNLRQSVISHFQNNTGADWWRYRARGTVNLDSHMLSFGHETGSAISGTAGAVHLYAGGQPAISAKATGASGEVTSGTLTVTDLTFTESTVTITATCVGIDASLVHVEWTETLSDAMWLTVADERSVADSVITLTVPRPTGATSGFYRLVAEGSVAVIVTIAGDLEVTGGIILTSPSGKKFRVTVADDGTLTTAEVTE